MVCACLVATPAMGSAQEGAGEEHDVAPGQGVGLGIYLLTGSNEGLGVLLSGSSGIDVRWGMGDVLVGEFSGSLFVRSVEATSNTVGELGGLAGLSSNQSLVFNPALALYYALPATPNARLLAGVRVSSANTWIKQDDSEWGEDLTWSITGGPVVSGEYIAGGVLGVGFEAGLSIGYSAGDGIFDSTSAVGLGTNTRITLNYYF